MSLECELNRRQWDRFDDARAELVGQRWTQEQADALILLIRQGAACMPPSGQEFPDRNDTVGSKIAAGVSPPSPDAKAAGAHEPPAPAADIAADLHPHCALGEVSFGRRWTVRAPEAAGMPFRIEGDGIAFALDVAHAAELHVQLGAALVANLALRIAQVRA